MIDFRVRPPYKDFLNLGLFDDMLPKADISLENPFSIGRKRINSAVEQSMSKFMDEMDAAGIDIAVVMGRRTGTTRYGDIDNIQLYELCNEYPGRFIAFGGVNPMEKDMLEQIKHMSEDWGFKGMAVDGGWYAAPMHYDDERLFPLYEACIKHNCIVSLTASSHMGSDLSYCDPLHIQRAALRYPELKIVIPHGCWPFVARAIGICLTCPNIWLMPDVYLYMKQLAFTTEIVHAANGFLRHRVLFGSTYPGYGLDQAVECWKSILGWEEGALLDSLHYNAHKLLGLS